MKKKTRVPLNYGAFVGHIALRLAVMGVEAWERSATSSEIDQIVILLEDALKSGALGVSTNLLDHDGEDRPIEIKDLINKINEKPENSVVAKRVKRAEGLIFQMLYQIHKLITFIFTGRKVNFGNYSCLTKRDIKILSDKASLWSSFSGSIKKNLINLNETDSIRGLRYFGPSKMSLFNLIIHSFSIIAVFKYTVFLRSTFMIIILSFLINTLGSIAITIQILIVFFNLLIFIVSMRENEKALFKSNDNILNENEITH